MKNYTKSASGATAPDNPIPNRRATFAHQCALDAFGRGAIHHLNSAAFQEREPIDEPLDPDEAVDGREAVARWLKLAATVEGEAAETAYQIADELRRVLGLSWADVLGRKAA